MPLLETKTFDLDQEFGYNYGFLLTTSPVTVGNNTVKVNFLRFAKDEGIACEFLKNPTVEGNHAPNYIEPMVRTRHS